MAAQISVLGPTLSQKFSLAVAQYPYEYFWQWLDIHKSISGSSFILTRVFLSVARYSQTYFLQMLNVHKSVCGRIPDHGLYLVVFWAVAQYSQNFQLTWPSGSGQSSSCDVHLYVVWMYVCMLSPPR